MTELDIELEGRLILRITTQAGKHLAANTNLQRQHPGRLNWLR